MDEDSVTGWLLNEKISIAIKKNRVFAFGRLPHDDNDERVYRIKVDDPHVSATHCYIWSVQFDTDTDSICYFKDTSRNGCIINGKRSAKGKYRILNYGDYIQFSKNSTFIYRNKRNSNSMEREIVKIQNWEILPNVIGFGTFGKVQIARNVKENDLFYAVKTVQINQNNESNKEEHEILKKIHHKNIIEIRETLVEARGGIMKLFQELAVGGDLFSYLSQDGRILKKIPESEAVFALYQICNGLNYLHENGIVHRDLKLDNILIMGVPIRYPILKIGDFGIAKQHLPLGDSQVIDLTKWSDGSYNNKHNNNRTSRKAYWMNTMVGTAEYAAPEINLLSKIKKEKEKKRKKGQGILDIKDFFIEGNKIEGRNECENEKETKYTEKVDSWSLGVVGHILLSGVSPFYSESLEETILQSRRGIIYIDNGGLWEGISNVSKDFIRGCLQVDSNKRLSIKECVRSEMFNLGKRKELIQMLLRTPRS